MGFYDDVGTGIRIAPGVELRAFFEDQSIVEQAVELLGGVGGQVFKYAGDHEVTAECIQVPLQPPANEVLGGMKELVCQFFGNGDLMVICKEPALVSFNVGTGEDVEIVFSYILACSFYMFVAAGEHTLVREPGGREDGDGIFNFRYLLF